MKNRKRLILSLFSLIIAVSVIFTSLAFRGNNKKAHAQSYTYEPGSILTFSTKDSISFSEVKNWDKKMLVLDIKTDGTKTKLQLKGTSGESGILRSKPDRAVDTADECAFENIATPYWAPDCYATSLGDGWYRWVFKLSELKKNSMSNTANTLYCLEGNNVQIKNIAFYDIYADVSKIGYLPITISNFKNETISFDAYVPDDALRRFQLVKSDGVGVTGIIRYNKTSLSYENPDYVSGVNDWMVTSPIEPISLGDDWYRYTLDLGLVKRPSEATGTETVDRLKNLTETDVNIQMKNFYVVPTDYDFTVELGNPNDLLEWESSNGFISDWTLKSYNISFDYFGDPNGSFSFGTTDSNRVTNKFTFIENGVLKSDKGTVCGEYSESELGLGWMHVSLNLADLGQYGSTTSQIKYLRSDGAGSLFIKNFTVQELYDPSSDADIVLKKNARTTIPDIPLWGLSVISFEVNHATLDSNVDPQFIFGEKGQDKNITGYFGYKDINNDLGLYLGNAKFTDGGSEPYWIKASTQPVEIENGWYKWTIDLSELSASGSFGAETIGNIYNRGSKDVYVRNFEIVSTGDPSKDADVVLKSNKRTTIPDIPLWGITTVSFEVYHPTLDSNVDPQFIFGVSGTDRNATSYFGYKKINNELALYLTNPKFSDGGTEPYWIKSSTQPEAIGGGWYKWTIDFTELKYTGGCIGSETIGNIHNRGAYDVYIRNFKIESVKDISKEADLVLKANTKTELPKNIPYWQYSTISFEIYHPTLNTIEDPQFQLFVEGAPASSTGFFGYSYIENNYGLYIRNADKRAKYWILNPMQPEDMGGGWYKWTINLQNLGVGEKTNGTETLSHILNRRGTDVYIRNFEVETEPFVLLENKEMLVPFGSDPIKNKLNARIVGGDGKLIYESSDSEVASVDDKGNVIIKKTGTALITISVENDDSIRPAVCTINSLGLKNYPIYNLDEFTDGETSLDFPLVKSKEDNIKYYTYEEIEENNPSVVVRFLVSATYLEPNRQAFTIWGANENALFDGNYGLWAVCYNGAFVFDIYGSNGSGGIYVNGINTIALNSHNTLVQPMTTFTDYYIEAGAIDLEELINGQQYTYFYLKVNGTLVWTTLDVAQDSFRNPIIAFTSTGASRATAKKVDLVTLTLDVNGEQSTFDVANGLKLPEPEAPEVMDADKKFIGWKNLDGTFFDFDRDTVNGNLTLIAEITNEYHTVNYDINYDEKGIIDTIYVGYDMSFKAPISDPIRDGYRFKWWSNEENGKAFSFGTPTTSDFTLYAVWVKVHKVSFVYENNTYLSVYYDEGANILDPGWGYQDNPLFGKWLDRGMFELNHIANGRAPYYTLSEGGERIDFDKVPVTVNEDTIIYINFMEVETVKEENEEYTLNSKWDYVSLRDLNDKAYNKDEYFFTKYDTSTSTYTPNKNNTTDSVIFQGEILLGKKFKGVNSNIGVLGLRSSLNVYNSINVWLRTKEVYLETRVNGISVHLAFESYENVLNISEFTEVVDGVTYLKTDVYIPIEFGILAVITPGYEDYDRVYFKINGSTVFDCIIPKYGKSKEGASYRVGFVTDGDTEQNTALSVKGVYPKFEIKFLDKDGNEVASPITIEKHSFIVEPTYKLPEVSGKKFVGWYNENTKLMWDFKKDRIKTNMVLVPTYGYEVKLDPNDGGFPDGKNDSEQFGVMTKLVGEGCYIGFPTDPLKDEGDDLNYVFAGWEKEDGTLWDKEKDTVTSDLYLKARWDIYVVIKYYIEDESYEWDSKKIKQGSVVGESKYGDPDAYDALLDDDYEFTGWFILDEKGDLIEIDLNTYVANYNTEIYAIFEDTTAKKDDPSGEDDPDEPIVDPVRPTYGCAQGKGCMGSIGGTLILVISIMSSCIIIKNKNKKENE